MICRIKVYKTICALILSIISFTICAQSDFSLVNDHGLYRTINELLYETDEAYYTIGYAEDLINPELGLHVSCHDKKTGDVCHSYFYTIKNRRIFTNGRTPVFQSDNALIFGAKTSNIILKLKYDLESKSVSLIDSIVNPLPGSYYLNDMILAGDTTIYLATVLQDGGNITSIIHKYPNGSTKHIYITNPPDLTYSGGRFIRKPNGNFIIFGSLTNNKNLYRDQLAITEIDSFGAIIREFRTPPTENIWSVSDITLTNENEVLILAKSDDWDPIWEKRATIYWVYKFDLENYQVIWRKKYEQPVTSFVSTGAEIIKGHKENEFLYCSHVAAEGVSLDSFMTKARIVKIKDDGSKIWHKDYSYYNGDQKYNRFITLIPTSDGNYLIGGSASSNVSKAWLVKINEDGDIVPVDTTSSAIDWAHDDLSKQISIYPNPATDIIIINQAEISEVTYHICDLHGTLLRTMNIKDSHHNVTWDIHDLVSGVYIIDMMKDGVSIGSKKVVVR
jgi:Secretion system C-terminal sorting domain